MSNNVSANATEISADWLVIISSHPSFSRNAEAGVDLALACGAFGQSVNLLLLNDGLELLNPKLLYRPGERDLHKVLLSLPLYDVEHVAVAASATLSADTTAAVHEAGLIVNPLEAATLSDYPSNHRFVMSF